MKNFIKSLAFFVILVIFNGCDIMDSFLPSSSAYKLNARVSGIPIDDCSFVTINDKIQPYFEASIAGDPDVTALLVFFRNSRGGIEGSKFLYAVNGEADRDEILIQVGSFSDLPVIPMPANLPVGRYTMVSQVMRGREVLQRTEKAFYYLGNTNFTYDGINVYFPGITDNSQIIPLGLTILLEAKIDFNSQVDPYIVWYNGRRKISEGHFSEGAGFLLWKAPEQSGVYSVSAEVFPSDVHIGLSGYQKEVSLLVSAKTMDMNLVSEIIPELVHWYTFEGSLNDSQLAASSLTGSALAAANAERSLKTQVSNRTQWLPADGSYGLAAGYDKTYTFPSAAGYNDWQTLFRFMPVNDGVIFSAQFSSNVSLVVSVDGQYLVLTLSSQSNTASQRFILHEKNSFVTAGVSFSVTGGSLAARINVTGDSRNELPLGSVLLDVDIDDNFQIILGHKQEDNLSVLTAIFDEFALYKAPPIEIILADVKKADELTDSRNNYVSSN